MTVRSVLSSFVAIFLVVGLTAACTSDAQQRPDRDPIQWEVHDEDRPQPPIVDPGPAPEEPQPVPDDATVLFDGTDLDAWESVDEGEAPWRLGDGYMEVEPGSGDIQSREEFGDVQVHVEWAAPEEIDGEGQGRGNSGVFLMGLYEMQVLDSYENPTYPDGQNAAIYGQYPPLVNASRAPGEWQTFDIYFERPHFDDTGELVKPARVTAFHNGVLVLEGVELTGPVGHQERPPYEEHEARLPLMLQDHGDKVRFRSVWVRDLEE